MKKLILFVIIFSALCIQVVAQMTHKDSVYSKGMADPKNWKEYKVQRNDPPNMHKPKEAPRMTPEDMPQKPPTNFLLTVHKKELEMILMGDEPEIGQISLKSFLKKFKGDSVRITPTIFGQTYTAAQLTASETLRLAKIDEISGEYEVLSFTRNTRYGIAMVKVIVKKN